jgi:hypothetical protein
MLYDWYIWSYAARRLLSTSQLACKCCAYVLLHLVLLLLTAKRCRHCTPVATPVLLY